MQIPETNRGKCGKGKVGYSDCLIEICLFIKIKGCDKSFSLRIQIGDVAENVEKDSKKIADHENLDDQFQGLEDVRGDHHRLDLAGEAGLCLNLVLIQIKSKILLNCIDKVEGVE